MTNIHSMEISISYGNMTMLTAHGNWLHAYYSQSRPIRLEITAIQNRFLDTFLEGKKKLIWAKIIDTDTSLKKQIIEYNELLSLGPVNTYGNQGVNIKLRNPYDNS